MDKKNRVEKILESFLENVVKIHSKRSVLIVSSLGPNNSNGFLIGQVLFKICSSKGCQTNMITQTPRLFSSPMDKLVYEAMTQNYDLIFQTDVDSLGHDFVGKQKPHLIGNKKFTNILYFRKYKKEVTTYWFYISNLKTWLNTVDTDYSELGKLSLRLERKLNLAKEVSFISNDGKSKLSLRTNPKNRAQSNFNFKQHLLGAGGNIPLGEVSITPNMNYSEGEIVIDGSFYQEERETTIKIKKPVVIKFRRGIVISIEGGKEAKILQQMLENIERETKKLAKTSAINGEYLKNIYRIGEFAVGVNKKAKVIGDLLIDEKSYGTAHIALGRSYDGDPALVHCDLVVRQPEIKLIYSNGQEETVVKNGQVLV